ncbi:type II toxin-antitoxin system RelE/ParE family toxin [bacterium]|nr:MAG: type II toxin-antitoxin system RelE/ParE family toxin [bacterium]
MLKNIKDLRIRKKVIETIDSLEYEPDKKGKPMIDDLIGFKSIRSVGQRYRVLYKIDQDKIIVFVVALGIRKDGDKKDIYSLAKKLIKQGLI